MSEKKMLEEDKKDLEKIAKFFNIKTEGISYVSMEGAFYGATNEGYHFIAGRANTILEVEIYKNPENYSEPDYIQTISQ